MTLRLGPDWQRDLWASPYRLRFELNRDGSYISMFTNSYDRARALARATLPADELTAVIAAYPYSKRELGAKRRGWKEGSGFDLLEAMGVRTESTIASWDGYWWPEDGKNIHDKPLPHRAIRLSWDEADILIWNQVAHDIGVTPQAPVMSKLLDVEGGVSVDVYDDRGMDITAISRDALSPLYQRFDEWLLDYDRPRMTEAFQALA